MFHSRRSKSLGIFHSILPTSCSSPAFLYDGWPGARRLALKARLLEMQLLRPINLYSTLRKKNRQFLLLCMIQYELDLTDLLP